MITAYYLQHAIKFKPEFGKFKTTFIPCLTYVNVKSIIMTIITYS